MTHAELFFELAQACADCRTEDQFQRLVRQWVRPLLPHGLLAAVLGRIDLEHLEICRFVGVDYPEEALRQLPLVINLRERPVVQRWVQTREPLVLQLPEDAQLMSERGRFEVEAFQLGRLAIHGLVDLAAKTGSYFSFGQVPVDIDKRALLTTLALVAPLLHQALMAVHQNTVEPKPSPLSILSPAERELLQWVAAGRSNNEIAHLRGRSAATVRNQIHSAFVKLGVSSRIEAVRIVLKTG
jgi:LuxR family transcriptional regulator, quorum-sensing system regulator CviR